MALAAMRRHRRWLYGFLWIVILAFIILYVPALTDARPGHAGRDARGAWAACTSRVGEYQRAYNRAAAVLRAALPGPARREHDPAARARGPGARDARLRAARGARGEAARASRVATRRWRARSPPPPTSRTHGRFIGKDEIRRRLELAGHERGRVRGVAARSGSSARASRALIGATACGRATPRWSASSAGAPSRCRLEYVLVDAARYRAAGRGRPTTR